MPGSTVLWPFYARLTEVSPHPVQEPGSSPGPLPILASRNTLELFLLHGGVGLGWTSPGAGDTTSLTRLQCEAMLCNMRVWLQSSNASLQAIISGTDLDRVRLQMNRISEALPELALTESQSVQFVHSDEVDRDDESIEADCLFA